MPSPDGCGRGPLASPWSLIPPGFTEGCGYYEEGEGFTVELDPGGPTFAGTITIVDGECTEAYPVSLTPLE